MGIDNIGPKLLRNCALALYLPIHHLFTSSLGTGVVPSEWKLHIISPVHKIWRQIQSQHLQAYISIMLNFKSP